jgi:hypothetical protein
MNKAAVLDRQIGEMIYQLDQTESVEDTGFNVTAFKDKFLFYTPDHVENETFDLIMVWLIAGLYFLFQLRKDLKSKRYENC